MRARLRLCSEGHLWFCTQDGWIVRKRRAADCTSPSIGRFATSDGRRADGVSPPLASSAREFLFAPNCPLAHPGAKRTADVSPGCSAVRFFLHPRAHGHRIEHRAASVIGNR